MSFSIQTNSTSAYIDNAVNLSVPQVVDIYNQNWINSKLAPLQQIPAGYYLLASWSIDETSFDSGINVSGQIGRFRDSDFSGTLLVNFLLLWSGVTESDAKITGWYAGQGLDNTLYRFIFTRDESSSAYLYLHIVEETYLAFNLKISGGTDGIVTGIKMYPPSLTRTDTPIGTPFEGNTGWSGTEGNVLEALVASGNATVNIMHAAAFNP